MMWVNYLCRICLLQSIFTPNILTSKKVIYSKFHTMIPYFSLLFNHLAVLIMFLLPYYVWCQSLEMNAAELK